MKKMLFSAIALIAFTTTSMAGEIPDTKEVTEIDCCAVSNATYKSVKDNGGTSDAAMAAAYAAHTACENEKSKKSAKKVTTVN
jgi:hypothetical protein